MLYVFNKMDRVDLASFDNPWLLNQGSVSAPMKNRA